MPWKIFDAYYGKRIKPEDGDVIGFDITVMDVIQSTIHHRAAPWRGRVILKMIIALACWVI